MNSDSLISTIVTLAMLYIAYKLWLLLWRKVLVPTTKLAWKAVTGLSTIIFFVALFLFREAIFDHVSPEAKYLIIAVLGMIAGIKFLRSRKGG